MAEILMSHLSFLLLLPQLQVFEADRLASSLYPSEAADQGLFSPVDGWATILMP